MLPAVGQGALGLETRADDTTTNAAVRSIDDAHAHAAVAAERGFLAAIGAGCLAPVGALATVAAGEVTLDVAAFSVDGVHRLAERHVGPVSEAAAVGTPRRRAAPGRRSGGPDRGDRPVVTADGGPQGPII